MSLWQVNDASTAGLLNGFYEHLVSGAGTGESLRRSQLAYLSEVDEYRASPYYWAALVSIGDHRPLFEDERTFNPLLVAGLITAVLFVLLTFFRFQRRQQMES
jgi:hypothetical protein